MEKKNNTILELNNISKSFGTTKANDNISLKFIKGSIHIIAGENGSGKSTLMSTIFGLHQPDSGTIKVRGVKTKIKDAKHANDLGIGMVHQHFKQIAIFNALDNIILGAEPVKNKFILDKKKAKEIIVKEMNDYKMIIPLDVPSEHLTVGQQQKLEILKLLYRKSEILILDEPTAVLTADEIEGLIKTIKEFKKSGKTIIVITHKLDEIEKLADYITVVRHGRVTDSFTRKELTQSRLTKAIVGRSIQKIKYEKTKIGDKILELKNLNVDKYSMPGVKGIENLSLKIHAGEIVAIAGVEGNGQKELALSVTGLVPLKSGKILFKSKDITKSTIKERYSMGFGHIPEDRHGHGIVMDWNASKNAVLQEFEGEQYSKNGILNRVKMKESAERIIQKFDVRGTKKGDANLGFLSGGNQQKFIVGREMLRPGTDLLIITQPTRGLDVGAIQYIHSEILKSKKYGKAILLISYELSEVLELADRVLVINSGKITGELSREEMSKSKIAKLMTSKAKRDK